MKLTILSSDNVFEHEVDPSMEVQDIQALIAAEAELSADSILLTNDSGEPLSVGNRSLESYGLKGDSTLFLTLTNQAASSSSSSSSTLPLGFPGNDADLERMRLQALGNPALMSELQQRDPEMARAVTSGQKFKELFLGKQVQARQAKSEKQRLVEALNEDPYDIEAQKKIEEAIRMEAVMENMTHAMEHSPEAFGTVHMLYINVEVNGHPVKAFVDSGAQATIISPDCAEKCGIMRLLDTRFAGMAVGVGTARILGRVHAAQIRLGDLFLPCAFTVMEGKSVDILFGLDMLKRYQCCIDLKTNVLRIDTTEIPFLPEHELPDQARRMKEAEVADEMNQAAGEGISPVAGGSGGLGGFPGSGQALGGSTASRGAASGGSASSATALSGNAGQSEASVQILVDLGAPRPQAIQLLAAADGNVDVAVSMLFG